LPLTANAGDVTVAKTVHGTTYLNGGPVFYQNGNFVLAELQLDAAPIARYRNLRATRSCWPGSGCSGSPLGANGTETFAVRKELQPDPADAGSVVSGFWPAMTSSQRGRVAPGWLSPGALRCGRTRMIEAATAKTPVR